MESASYIKWGEVGTWAQARGCGTAQEGASVLVNDTGCEIDGTGSSNQPANQVVSEIKSNGGNALANYADVSLMENGEAIIKSAIDNFGHLDILVNSARIL